MATLLPESVTRLQARAFVENAELSNLGRGEIIRHVSKDMAEKCLRKLLHDCVKTEEYLGYQGQTLYLDVCVIAPNELFELLKNAREEGKLDAFRWAPRLKDPQ